MFKSKLNNTSVSTIEDDIQQHWIFESHIYQSMKVASKTYIDHDSDEHPNKFIKNDIL